MKSRRFPWTVRQAVHLLCYCGELVTAYDDQLNVKLHRHYSQIIFVCVCVCVLVLYIRPWRWKHCVPQKHLRTHTLRCGTRFLQNVWGLDLEDEGTTFLRNFGSHHPSIAASRSRRSESLATPLWEPQISQNANALTFRNLASHI